MKKKTDLDKLMDDTAVFVKKALKMQRVPKPAMEVAIAAIVQNFMFLFDKDGMRIPPEKWGRSNGS